SVFRFAFAEYAVIRYAFRHFNRHIQRPLLAAQVDYLLLNGYEGSVLAHEAIFQGSVDNLVFDVRVGLAGLRAEPVLALQILDFLPRPEGGDCAAILVHRREIDMNSLAPRLTPEDALDSYVTLAGMGISPLDDDRSGAEDVRDCFGIDISDRQA